MKFQPLLFILLFLFSTNAAFSQDETELKPADQPPATLPAPVEIEVKNYQISTAEGQLLFRSADISGPAKINLNGEEREVLFRNGRASLPFEFDRRGKLALLHTEASGHQLYHFSQQTDGAPRIRRIPFWLSVLPPLVAIALALIFKEVVVSLFVGVWAGAFIAGGMRVDSFYYFFDSILSVVERYDIGALADTGHLSVIVFSLLIGGMVAIISRNGGMAGVVMSLSRFAKSPRSTQFVTWLLGVAIFFDDYANTLIVGNTMRSVTDRFNISREKLAYIVDSTAAPVSAVAFITTWIGAELGYIDSGLELLTHYDGPDTPYAVFLASLKYSFYPVLTLAFILFLIYLNRDYGPMLKAETRARTTGKVAPAKVSEMEHDDENLDPVAGAPLKWHNAAIPVFVVILMTIYGLIDTGMSSLAGEISEAGIALPSHSWGSVWSGLGAMAGEGAGFFFKVGKLIGSADSYVALLWASFSGVLVAIVMTLAGKIMSLGGAISTMTTGFKAMLPALIILTLAWSLATTTEELHTATFLSHAMQGSVNPYVMPVIVFVLAAFISFSTGSSWSTMAILYPIAIPTTWAVCLAANVEHDTALEILLNVISVTLGASVLGDHCSPISDTTILSSLASDCNHIDHVRTQMPYALTVGLVSLTLCFVSTLLGGGWLLCTLLLLAGLAGLFFFVRWYGKPVPDSTERV